MSFILMSSLEHRSLIKLAINLWIQDDIVALMAKFNFKVNGEEKWEKWLEIENKVTKNFLQVPQPRYFIETISSFIKPIGIEILKFTEYHLNILGDVYINANLSKLFWTPVGTVDKKKTAKILIKDVKLDITSRYELACIFCLEDDIPRLWSQIDEDLRDNFYGKSHGRLINQNRLVSIWTSFIKGEEERLKSMYKSRGPSYTLCQYAFESAAEDGNIAAAEFFFQKLSISQAEHSLVLSTRSITDKCCITKNNVTDFPNKHYVDVLYFLLSQMKEEQRIRVYEIHHTQILECFLDWPWQRLFMEMANRMWDYLDEQYYSLLLQIIVFKVLKGYKDYSYEELFGEFWQQSPVTHRKYVIDDCASENELLSALFTIKDKKNIIRILEDATVSQKKKLISCERGREICQDLLFDREWYLLEIFIRECVQSKNELIKFKQEFTERAIQPCSKNEFCNKNGELQKFFRLLDVLFGISLNEKL